MLVAPKAAPESGAIDPIDIVETLAEHYKWKFDRLDDKQIALEIKGVWSTYSVTVADGPTDQNLRVVATFELKPPTKRRQSLLLELQNRVNDMMWFGPFTWWETSGRITWKTAYRQEGSPAKQQQVDKMIADAVILLERFYPAMYGVCWAGQDVDTALKMAFDEAYGRA